MTMYYDLPGTESIEPQHLQLERAGQVLQAVIHDKDCKFIECRRAQDDGREIIVIELQAHGIPTRAHLDIQFSERIAFVVHRDPQRFVAALMLRKDFPTLLHQNQTGRNSPRDLCLHYEPRATVMRTWTAQRFIRRVKWWLVSSSTGTLHAADQPPETLFFNYGDELVVPRNFDELVEAGQKFYVAVSEDHISGGHTYVLSAATEQSIGLPEPIQLMLPPVVHNSIEDAPQTMEVLAEIYMSRGVDILALIREQISSRLVAQLVEQPFGGKYTIIVLHTPMQRSADEAPSRVIHSAFIIFEPFLEVGRKIGALLLHEGKYFRETVLSGQVPEVRNLDTMKIIQFALLRKNDVTDFCEQSGSDDAGVKSVLIGAGALGSSLLNLWARQGWGTWTVIDKDHIKPHNLSRHVATDAQIGREKAPVVSEAAVAATQDPGRFAAFQADATLLTDARVAAALGAASLVIDASTTLEYPRVVSDDIKLPRHISVFITPSGRSSVLLAENADRSINMRAIEAQYYRALINQPWGKSHLVGNLGSFWSGASCRDISFRLPLAQVQVHAANLAQMVILAAKSDAAKIAIWHRDIDTGAVYPYTATAFKETIYEPGGFTTYLDEELEQELRTMRAENLPNETGGILLGYHDLPLKRIVIVKACPAPPDSVGTPVSFVRGIQGVADVLTEVGSRTANIVGYVGEWHSHPRGHSADPSRDDVVQLVGLALSMIEDGLPALQLIVGETNINVTLAESR